MISDGHFAILTGLRVSLNAEFVQMRFGLLAGGLTPHGSVQAPLK